MNAPKEPGMMYKKHAKKMSKKMEEKKEMMMKKKAAKPMMKKMPKLGTGKRFASLTKKLAGKGAKNPKALAAAIGRKKFGGKKMAMLAAKGKK